MDERPVKINVVQGVSRSAVSEMISEAIKDLPQGGTGGSVNDTFATLNGNILTLASGKTFDLTKTVDTDTDTFATISSGIITLAEGDVIDLGSIDTNTFATLNGNILTLSDGQTFDLTKTVDTDTDTFATIQDSVITFSGGETLDLSNTGSSGQDGQDGADGLSTPNSVTGNENINNELNQKADSVAVSNEFDLTRRKEGFILGTNGEQTPNTSYFVTHPIACTANEVFYSKHVNRVIQFLNGNYEALFDEDGNILTVLLNNRPITIPDNPNIKYFIATSSSDHETYDIRREATSIGDYEPYKKVINPEQLVVPKSAIKLDEKYQLEEIEGSVNLFEESQNIFRNDSDFYLTDKVLGNDGLIATVDNDKRVSVEKEVLPDYATHVFFNKKDRLAFLDKDSVIIGSLVVGGGNIVTPIPEGAYYLSYSLLKSDDLSTIMVAYSDAVQPYKSIELPVRKTFNNFGVRKKDTGVLPLEVVLEDEIIQVIGRPKVIHNYGIVAVNNVANFDFVWFNSTGSNKVRDLNKGVLIDHDVAGEYSIRVEVYDNYGALVGYAESTLKVINNVTGYKTLDMLVISDSLIDNKDSGLNEINKNKTPIQTTGSKISPEGNRHEATGGTRAGSYLGEVSGFQSPIVNSTSGEVDLNNYLAVNTLSIGMIYIQLGSNGFSSITPSIGRNIEAEQIEELINKINASGGSSYPIILANPIMLAPQDTFDNKIAGSLLNKQRIIDLKKRYKDIAKRISNVFHLDQAAFFDSEINYLAPDPVKLNSYSSVEGLLAFEIIHPFINAYGQLGGAALDKALSLIDPNADYTTGFELTSSLPNSQNLAFAGYQDQDVFSLNFQQDQTESKTIEVLLSNVSYSDITDVRLVDSVGNTIGGVQVFVETQFQADDTFHHLISFSRDINALEDVRVRGVSKGTEQGTTSKPDFLEFYSN